MLRRSFRLVYTLGFDNVRTVTGNERNVFLIRRRNHETADKKKLNPEDTFGTLAPSTSYPEPDSDDDNAEGEYFGKKDTVKKIQACLDAHAYDDAVKLLRIMQKKERSPAFVYSMLISYNAKIGNAEEAFRLYNDFKKRHYYKRGGILTSLFMACGNCQRSDIALKIARKVLTQILSTEKTPNLKWYHAMFRAFGRHGDMVVLFQLMDRLKQKKVPVSSETYSRLLEGCISDKSSGLRLALLIWHHMLKENIKPNLYAFKTMAKCIQVCSLGDVDLIKDFLNMIVGNDNRDKVKQFQDYQKLPSESHMLEIGGESVVKLGDINSSDNNTSPSVSDDMLENKLSDCLYINDIVRTDKMSCSTVTNQVNQSESHNNITLCDDVVMQKNHLQVKNLKEMELPNIFHPKPTWGSVVDLGDMTNCLNRFMLFGGLEGFFKVMDHFQVKPDISLFSILAACIPHTKEAQEELLMWKEKYNVKSDIRFIHCLLKKRVYGDDTFQDFMDYLEASKIKPDFETLRIVSQTCKTREECKKWYELAKRLRIRITDDHAFVLLKNASRSRDIDYVSDVLAIAKEEGVVLSPKSLNMLQSTMIQATSKKAEE